MSQFINDVHFKELKDMIKQLNNTIERLNQTIDLQNKLLSEKEAAMAKMQAELKLLRRKLYGASRERTITDESNQLSFFNELMGEPKPVLEIIEPEYIEVSYKKAKKKKPALSEPFKDRPVKQYIVDMVLCQEKVQIKCNQFSLFSARV